MTPYCSCKQYIEDPYVCDDTGEPKGQCGNCGEYWFEHDPLILSPEDAQGAKEIREFQHSLKSS